MGKHHFFSSMKSFVSLLSHSSPFLLVMLTDVGCISLVLHSMDDDARKQLSPLKLRRKAAKFAIDTVKKQMKSFKVILSF